MTMARDSLGRSLQPMVVHLLEGGRAGRVKWNASDESELLLPGLCPSWSNNGVFWIFGRFLLMAGLKPCSFHKFSETSSLELSL